MDSCRHIWKQKWCKRLLVDIVLYVVVCCLIGLLWAGAVGTNQRGFFCGDETISLPYLGRDSVSLSVLAVASTVFPGIVIFLTELTKNVSRKERVSKGVLRFLKIFFHLIFNGVLVMLIVFVTKATLGYQRPNFLAVCVPNITSTNCTKGMYVSQYTCTNPSMTEHDFNDARQSFMSGHSCIAAASAVFLIIYCEFEWNFTFSEFMKPTAQVALLCYALFVGYTRINDNRHRWSDVLAGFATGALVSGWTALHVCKPRLHEGRDLQVLVNKGVSNVYQPEISNTTNISLPTVRVGDINQECKSDRDN